MSDEIAFIKPYTYELHGNGISITYTPKGVGAIPHLTIQDKDGTHNFNGNNINQSTSLLLTLVSVDMPNRLLGAPNVCFSLLVPEVNLLNQKDASALVHTKCIITTRRASSLPPTAHVGQVDSYEVIKLTGTASNSGIHPL